MIDTYPLKRLQDVASAVRMHRGMQSRERWPRERLLAFQRQRLAELVTHAMRHSAFYRERYRGIDPHAFRLEDLPTVSKSDMMSQFDAFVTDPRLRHADLEAHLETVEDDTLYQGEYRVMCSSGSTGRKGVYVYDRREWSEVLAGSMRWTDLIGVRPRLPRRTRIATINAPDAKHMTCRGGKSMDIGLFRMLRLSATLPLSELVERLNAFRPEAINAYPSTAAMLAQEQIEGRLHVAPRVVSTSSELRTEDMTQRIREAWGVEPFNCLGLTETGISAVDCGAHQGLHIFEDQCILEVVDERNRAVPAGQPGDRVLVTSLFRRTQPIIRMEVSDLLTVSEAPCPCGRSLARISVMGGRSDDVLELPGARGGRVRVHPIHLRSPLTRCGEVVQYQIVQERDGLDCRVVLAAGIDAASATRGVERALRDALQAQGAAVLRVDVRAVPSIERESGAGKFKLIKASANREAAPLRATQDAVGAPQ
jgi:phenylacetate-coenzyme A ligase PaaK-like adenylate-forming protein